MSLETENNIGAGDITIQEFMEGKFSINVHSIKVNTKDYVSWFFIIEEKK